MVRDDHKLDASRGIIYGLAFSSILWIVVAVVISAVTK